MSLWCATCGLCCGANRAAKSIAIVAHGSTPIAQPVRAIELLKRPEIGYDALIKMSGAASTLNLDENGRRVLAPG